MISQDREVKILILLKMVIDELAILADEINKPPLLAFTPQEWATYPEVLPGRKYPGDEISNPNDLPKEIVLDS